MAVSTTDEEEAAAEVLMTGGVAVDMTTEEGVVADMTTEGADMMIGGAAEAVVTETMTEVSARFTLQCCGAGFK